MTTADRQTDADPAHEGGAYRASAVDVTAQDDAARYEGTDSSTLGTTDDSARESGGYARHHDADATTDAGDATAVDERHDDSYTGGQRLDAQDTDLRDASGTTSTDTTATDEPRTDGGYPHSADTADSTSDSTYDGTADSTTSHDSTVDGYAAGRHTDSGVRTVDVSGTGTDSADHTGADHTTSTATTAGTGSAGSDKLERLVPSNRVDEYTSRWDAVKGEFVDEPRQAVAKADKLVGELLDELDQLFRKQRSDLEHGLDKDETSTEDLRLALRRYRSFFDRLLEL
jgi:hypothetical protein